MSQGFNESVVEEAAIQWFEALGYAYVNGGDITPARLKGFCDL